MQDDNIVGGGGGAQALEAPPLPSPPPPVIVYKYSQLNSDLYTTGVAILRFINLKSPSSPSNYPTCMRKG